MLEMTGGPRELTNDERYLLRIHEDEISRAEQTHYRALGKNYQAIRDRRLYRAFGRWEDYCKARWGRTKQDADRKIRAAEVAEDLEAHGLRAPITEKQARPLGRLTSSERVRVALRVEEAGGWRRVTARRVAEIAVEVAPRASKEVVKPETAGRSLVLVKSSRGVGPVTLARSGLLRDLEAMHAAAMRTAARGPHAIPDAAAALSAEEAERVRSMVENAGRVLLRWSEAINVHHGAEPAGQQRMLLAA